MLRRHVQPSARHLLLCATAIPLLMLSACADGVGFRVVLVAAERLPVPVRVARAPAALRDRMVRAVHPALAARLDPAVVTAREVPAVPVGLLVLVAPLARVDPLAPPDQAAQDRPVLVDLPAQADPRGQEVQPDPAARPAAIPAPLAGSRQAVRRSSGQVGRALWST